MFDVLFSFASVDWLMVPNFISNWKFEKIINIEIGLKILVFILIPISNH